VKKTREEEPSATGSGEPAGPVEPGPPEALGAEEGPRGDGPSLAGGVGPVGEEPAWTDGGAGLSAPEDDRGREREPRKVRRSSLAPVLSALGLAVAVTLAVLVAKPTWLGFEGAPTPPPTPPPPPTPVRPERSAAESKGARPATPTPTPTPVRPERSAAESKGERPATPPPTPTPKSTAKPPAPRPARKVDPLQALLADARKLRDRGRAGPALEAYGRVLETAPENADALAGRGLCYLDLSQPEQARASFEAALQVDAQHGDALMGLAETFRYEGRRAEAVQFYERYLAAHPRGESAGAARNAIEAMKE
jgi:tetratricopeptide repeat protein